MINLLCGIFLLGWGCWSIFAIFKKKKAQVMIFYNEAFIPKKILGKYFDPVMNLLFGVLEILAGYFLTLDYFSK